MSCNRAGSIPTAQSLRRRYGILNLFIFLTGRPKKQTQKTETQQIF